METLESEIKKIIKKVYDREYIGILKVKVDGNIYITEFYFNGDTPYPSLSIISQNKNNDDYLAYIEKELKHKGLHQTKFYRLLEHIKTCDK